MKLIDAESLLTKFNSGALLFQPDIRKIIEEEPEGIIRCKDCRFYHGSNFFYLCCRSGEEIIVSGNDYCSKAKRRQA